MTAFGKHPLGLIGTVALALTACGGGSGGGSTGDTPGSTTPTAVVKLTGHFVDAPVAGLCWHANPSGLAGVSNATGDYQFVAGDSVSFAIPTSPGNCTSATLALGSLAPSAPASGDVQSFVLDVANGQRIAEVLNALNHGSSTAMDVSGLTMPSATASALASYISTGTAPTGATSTAVLAAAQTATTTAASYVLPVTATFSTSVDSHLAQSVSSLPAATVSLADLPGTLWFRMDGNGEGGLHRFDSPTQLSSVEPLNGGVSTGALAFSGNSFTLAAGTANEAKVTINYRDAQRMLYSSVQAANSSVKVTGTLTALQALSLSDVAGKTLNFTGLDSCNGAPIDMVLAVSSDGTVWQSQTWSAVTLTASIDAALPGLIRLANGQGTVVYLGLPKGASVAPGSQLAQVATSRANGNTNAPLGLLRLAAVPASAPVCSSGSGGGGASSGGTVVSAPEGQVTLTSQQLYVRYASSRGDGTPGPLAVLPKGYQLCLFNDTVGTSRACGQVSDGVNAGVGGSGNFANQMVLSTGGLGQAGSRVWAGWVDTATGRVLATTSVLLDANANPPNSQAVDVTLQ